MAKVKQLKTNLKSGTPVADKKGAASVVNGSIIAEREGQTRTFSKLTWDLLPPDKEGWSIQSETPAAPKTTKAAKTPVAPPAPELYDFVVTQDYLDLHPDEAAKGTKVGETIQVEGTE